jgi:energy-coupling factor transporter ATP-binding protein EcfA2
MASPTPQRFDPNPDPDAVRIRSFTIRGLLGGQPHEIVFPQPDAGKSEPGILILSGQNGSGKTTILRMIAGLLELAYDMFRKIPFTHASLVLSNGDVLSTTRTDNDEFPLRVSFRDVTATLYKTKDHTKLSNAQNAARERFRELALPILAGINFQLLDIHRTLILLRGNRSPLAELTETRAMLQFGSSLVYEPRMRTKSARMSGDESAETPLADRVKRFMKDAQVDYRRFFSADDLDLLPRILERFQASRRTTDRAELLARVDAVQGRFSVMKRLGLQTDDANLSALADLLRDDAYQESHALTLLETYIEMQESQNKARELIAERLLGFEEIMDEFLIGKSIRIDPRDGLKIQTGSNVLEETDLSSGEYHFLYMMVSALLCQRSGSIIAIDEPELSLHVRWQRKVLNALARCAARASPLFIFATHSSAIAAEHADRVYSLSPVE